MARTAPIFLILAALLSACGSEDSDTAPVLSNLAHAPAALTTGQATRVVGTFDFVDPDGDIQFFWVAATPPVGDSATLGPRDAQGADGKTSGEMRFQVDLDPRLPGDYLLEVWVVDDADNASNRLQTTLPAQ